MRSCARKKTDFLLSKTKKRYRPLWPVPLLLYFQEKLDAQKRRNLGDDSQLKDIQGQEGQHSTQP